MSNTPLSLIERGVLPAERLPVLRNANSAIQPAIYRISRASFTTSPCRASPTRMTSSQNALHLHKDKAVKLPHSQHTPLSTTHHVRTLQCPQIADPLRPSQAYGHVCIIMGRPQRTVRTALMAHASLSYCPDVGHCSTQTTRYWLACLRPLGTI